MDTKGELKVLPNEPRIIVLTDDRNYVIASTCSHDKVFNENRTVPMVSIEEAEANAERLVLCWNEHDKLKAKADCHDELVEACENLVVEQKRYCLRQIQLDKCEGGNACKGGCRIYEAVEQAKTALAKAKPQS